MKSAFAASLVTAACLTMFSLRHSRAAPAEIRVGRENHCFQVPFRSAAITIDGDVSDPGWQTAAAFTGFRWRYEHLPKASEQTMVFVSNDADSLYLSFKCFTESVDKLTALAPADGCLNHQDDRIEMQLNLLNSDQAPTLYLIINCEGVIKTLYGRGGGPREGWDADIERAWGRGENFWTLEMRIPLQTLGKDNLQNEICSFSVARMGSRGITYLVPTKPGEIMTDKMVSLLFSPPPAAEPALTSRSRGALTVDGFLTGANKAIWSFDNGGTQVESLLLTVENIVNGKVHGKVDKEIILRKDSETADIFYPVLGLPDESVRFTVLNSRTGAVLYSSTNRISVLNPIMRTYRVPDPLFEELLDHSREKDARLNGSVAFGNEIGYRHATWRAARKFAAEYSLDRIMLQERSSRIHSLSYADWAKDIRPLPSTWDGAWQPEGMLHWLADGARDKGWNKPVCYTNYYVPGVDADGAKGMGPNVGFGYLFDPVNANAYLDTVEHVVQTYGDTLWAVFAGDEQFDQNFHRLMSDMKQNYVSAAEDSYLRKINEAIKTECGFGRFGIPFDIDQSHPDYPFCRSATMRWLQSKLRPVNRRLAEIVKAQRPDLAVISEDLMYALGGDLTFFDEYADIAAFQLIHPFYSRKQNWMFRTKFVKDLSGLEYVIPCPHEALDGYSEGSCHPEEMRQLYSQLIRGGATGILPWPAAYNGPTQPVPYSQSVVVGHPFAWEFMIEIMKSVSALPPLKFPETDSAIFVSMHSLQCKDDRYPAYWNLRRYDHLFNQLGTGSRAWFKFVAGERLLQDKENLEKYNTVYIPDIRYSTPEMAERLESYCNAGGTLVCLAPDAFEFNLDASSMLAFRERLFGVRTDGQVDAETVRFEIPGLQRTLKLLTRDLKKLTIVDPDSVAVIARFDTGEPAVVEKRIGKGRAIFFAYLPINEATLADEEHIQFWSAFHELLGCRTGHDIWRFTLPMPEVKVEPVPAAPENFCLTGNFGFWSRCHFHGSGSRFNLDLNGVYTIVQGNEKSGPYIFRQGKLTDRLRAAEHSEALIACGLRDAPPYIMPENWVETITDGRTALVEFSFPSPCLPRNVNVFYRGAMNGMQVAVSDNRRDWTTVAKVTEPLETGEYEVAKLAVVTTDAVPAKHVRLTFPARSDTASVLELVEVELWGDCPAITGSEDIEDSLSQTIHGSFDDDVFRDGDGRLRHRAWTYNTSSYDEADGFYELVADSFAGSYALRLHAAGSGTRGAGVYGNAVNLEPGSTVELAGQVRGRGSFQVALYGYNREKRFLEISGQSDKTALDTDAWQEFRLSFVIPAATDEDPAQVVHEVRPAMVVTPGSDVVFDALELTIEPQSGSRLK